MIKVGNDTMIPPINKVSRVSYIKNSKKKRSEEGRDSSKEKKKKKNKFTTTLSIKNKELSPLKLERELDLKYTRYSIEETSKQINRMINLIEQIYKDSQKDDSTSDNTFFLIAEDGIKEGAKEAMANIDTFKEQIEVLIQETVLKTKFRLRENSNYNEYLLDGIPKGLKELETLEQIKRSVSNILSHQIDNIEDILIEYNDSN